MFSELIAQSRLDSYQASPYRPRVSGAGKCSRAAVYDRLGNAQETDPAKINFFHEGNLHEVDMIAELKKIGAIVHSQQENIEIPANTVTGLIRGKIDGLIDIDDIFIAGARARQIDVPEFVRPGRYLLEAKSISGRGFDYLEDEPQEYHKAQAMIYLHKLLELGIDTACILYKNRDNGQYKEFWFQYDVQEALASIEKFEEIELYAQRNELPARVSLEPKAFPCSKCEFHELCWSTFKDELASLKPGNLPDHLKDKARDYLDLERQMKPLQDELNRLKKQQESIKEEVEQTMLAAGASEGGVAQYRFRIVASNRKAYSVKETTVERLYIQESEVVLPLQGTEVLNPQADSPEVPVTEEPPIVPERFRVIAAEIAQNK